MLTTARWNELFNGDAKGTSRSDLVRWWEARRWDFNVWVGVVGFITWWLVLIAGSAAVKPGVDFEEPLAMIVGPVIYACLANICYSLGPAVDFMSNPGRPRKALFKVGLLFSCFITALPGAWAVAAWVSTLITGHKLD